MHTFSGEKCVINHNGGFDGDVLIRSRESMDVAIRVPFEEIKEFVAHYKRAQLIGIIGDLSAEEVLAGVVEIKL